MKKVFALLTVSMVVTISSYAQGGGTLIFNTNPSQGVTGPFVFDCRGTAQSDRADSTFRGQIYTSAAQNGTFTAQGEALRFGMFNGAVNAGANGMILSDVVVTSDNVGGGTLGFYQIRVWSGSFNSYEDALSSGGLASGKPGISDTVSVIFGGGHPAHPSPSVDGFTSFNTGLFACIPEPTTVSIWVAGLAGLIVSRRRKVDKTTPCHEGLVLDRSD